MAGQGESNSSERKITARERQAMALRLRKAGATYAQIGVELGISEAGAYKAVQKALKDTIREPAEEYRQLHRDRLEEVLRNLWPGVMAGIPRSAEVALKALNDLAALDGLNAPKKIQDVTPLIEEARSLARQLGVDEDVAAAKAMEIIRAQAAGR